MSHWTNIDCVVDNLDALEQAATTLGATTVRNSEARGWFASDKRKADLVISIPGVRFDIAVIKVGTKYELQGDLYTGELEKFFGKGLARLGEEYQLVRIEREAKRAKRRTRRVKKGERVCVEIR